MGYSIHDMIKITETLDEAFLGLKEEHTTEEKFSYLQDLFLANFNQIHLPYSIYNEFLTRKSIFTESRTEISVQVSNEKEAMEAAKHENINELLFKITENNLKETYNIGQIAESFRKKLGISFSTENNLLTLPLKVLKNCTKYLLVQATDPTNTLKVMQILLEKVSPEQVAVQLYSDSNCTFSYLRQYYALGIRHFYTSIRGTGRKRINNIYINSLPTEKVISFANTIKDCHAIDILAFEHCFNNSLTLFK